MTPVVPLSHPGSQLVRSNSLYRFRKCGFKSSQAELSWRTLNYVVLVSTGKRRSGRLASSTSSEAMSEFGSNVPGPSTIHVIKKKKKQHNLVLSRSHDGQELNPSRKRKRMGVEDSSSPSAPRLQTISKGKEPDKPFIELQ